MPALLASAGAAIPLKAVVTLSPATSGLGQTVTAAVNRSTIPRGDALKAIRLSWGDGTKVVALANLSKRGAHRYAFPGAYTVRLTLTDAHNNVARGTAVEHVLVPSGSYTGAVPFNGLRFYVSAGRNTVQDVSDQESLHCSNGTGLIDELIVVSAAIKVGGAFTTSSTSTGILNGQPANYAYQFAGRFRWPGSGVAVAGTMRETISFPNSGVTCTTNTEAWSGQRDVQPAQTSTPPPAGSYTGSVPFNGLRFYVSAGRNTVQDVSGGQSLHCSDGSGFSDELIVPAAPVAANGSFSASVTDTGVVGGQPANYHWVFRGNFHSVGSNGAARAAGTMRETITFPDSGVTCTSNTEAWSGQRDVQPAQTSTPPPAGGYTGSFPFNGLTFTVASGTSITNVSGAQSLH
ncbi:MAG TPA: PKD domain-containing protein, partial [Jatrophihabitans sp.]|nr:PKD domain-containing protein [Jatrophihabitans sp.]